MVGVSECVSEVVELLGEVFVEPGELEAEMLWIMVGGVLVSGGFVGS